MKWCRLCLCQVDVAGEISDEARVLIEIEDEFAEQNSGISTVEYSQALSEAEERTEMDIYLSCCRTCRQSHILRCV